MKNLGIEYSAGFVSGIVTLAIFHPIDTIKVQIQTSTILSEYKGLRQCTKDIAKYALSQGFYRGMSAPLVSFAVTCGVYYGSYFHIVRWLRDEERSKRGAFCSGDFGSAMMAGSIAGIADIIVAVPVETVKTAMQAQVNCRQQFRVYHKSAWQCAKYIYQTGGLARLYRGAVALTFRDVPLNGLHFYVYESLAHPDSILRRLPLSLSSPPSPRASALVKDSVYTAQYQKLLEYTSPQRWGFGLGIYASAFVAGAIAGPVYWIGVMPFDVVKNRLQGDPERLLYSSMRDCIVKTYRREGWRVFWRGSALIIATSLPYSAVTFAVYELVVRALSGQKFDKERYRSGGLGFTSR